MSFDDYVCMGRQADHLARQICEYYYNTFQIMYSVHEDTYSSTATTASTLSEEERTRQIVKEIISNAQSVTYDDLARSTDAMEGSYIKVHGQIQQVLEDDTVYQGLISISYDDNPYYSYYYDNILYDLPKQFIDVRLLEGDVVTFYGVSEGLLTYTSAFNIQTTLPSMTVVKVVFD